MKSGVRILGIDDAAFNFEDDKARITGVVYRGTEFIEDIRFSSITIDGEDSTEKVIELYRKCNNPRQIKAVLIDGISLGGFNLVDIHKVADELDTPVIAVTSNEPDPEKFRRVMDKTRNSDKKFDQFDPYETAELEDGEAYIQFAGTSPEKAREIVRVSIIHGLTPEPIRVAHMIGQGLKDV
jgi:endonuclease V-like protein UPF0215 family